MEFTMLKSQSPDTLHHSINNKIYAIEREGRSILSVKIVPFENSIYVYIAYTI